MPALKYRIMTDSRRLQMVIQRLDTTEQESYGAYLDSITDPDNKESHLARKGLADDRAKLLQEEADSLQANIDKANTAEGSN